MNAFVAIWNGKNITFRDPDIELISQHKYRVVVGCSSSKYLRLLFCFSQQEDWRNATVSGTCTLLQSKLFSAALCRPVLRPFRRKLETRYGALPQHSGTDGEGIKKER